tara:strand:- start:1057 stop:1542 length:486 start_codon:yes stop_codon:yes gene_type:complete
MSKKKNEAVTSETPPIKGYKDEPEEEEEWEGAWEEDEYIDIFVYGTLMKGFGNHYFLQHEVFLGYGETKPEYTFYNLGNFPAMVAGGDTSVKGEIYEVHPQTVQWLDKLEGVAEGLYKREEITLAGSSPRGLTKVSTYIFPRENLEPRRDVPIKSGDWKKK